MHSPVSALSRRGNLLSSLLVAFVLICIVAFSLVFGLTTDGNSSYLPAAVIGLCLLIVLLALKQNVLIAICVVVIHLYADWYLGSAVIAPILTSALLIILYLARTPERPWEKPRALWLWGIFLAFSILPAIRGASLSRYDMAYFYPNIIAGALLMFWLGTVIASNLQFVRSFFILLSTLGALLAIITIIQSVAGVLLFSNSHFNNFLASVSDYQVFQGGQGSGMYRLGSYLVNPDWNGAFFALMFCIPLGLFIECDNLLGKLLYMVEALLIIPALLFTYSVGSWLSAGVALIVFVCLIGRWGYRIWILLILGAATMFLFLLFPREVEFLIQHGSDPTVLRLRQGAWKTAIKIIEAFPLTGINLGFQSYLLHSQPYIVPEQYRILAHPHNSYLELGAMAGLPVCVSFIALLAFNLWASFKNWLKADVRQRAMIGGGIAAVVALSFNSLSVNAWTLPPLAAFGWMLLGVVSSRLLLKKQDTEA